MTDCLVTRLRHIIGPQVDREVTPFVAVEYSTIKKAADRIEGLEAALRRIAQHDMQSIAMDALRPGERVREKKDER